MTRCFIFFFSSRRRHTRFDCDWSSDVCSSDLGGEVHAVRVDLAQKAELTRAEGLHVGRVCLGDVARGVDLVVHGQHGALVARHAGHEQPRSEEHTSELQSQSNLVCRLLLEKKKKYSIYM